MAAIYCAATFALHVIVLLFEGRWFMVSAAGFV